MVEVLLVPSDNGYKVVCTHCEAVIRLVPDARTAYLNVGEVLQHTCPPLSSPHKSRITEYFPEYPDDPRVKRIIHVHEDGSETVVYEIAEATHG